MLTHNYVPCSMLTRTIIPIPHSYGETLKDDRNDLNSDGEALKSDKKVLEGKEKMITVDTEALKSNKKRRIGAKGQWRGVRSK